MSSTAQAATASTTTPLGAAAAANTGKQGRIGFLHYGLIGLQLVLLLVLIRQYQIENAGFRWIMLITVAGFAVHALLPLKLRLPFFAALSVAATGMMLGVQDVTWMFLITAALVGICHLPASFMVRLVLLLLAGGILALQRVGKIASPWSEAVWPILGSMLMFRIIVYFYDLRHEKPKVGAATKISYFFMLPNASFPLFPVVDYKAFRRNYYDADAYRIYQRGIDWILRGVFHLILYRLVYYHLTITPAEVTTPAMLLQYLCTAFLTYFKVSGLFHLVVGILHLFGFHLPETHNRYFLAASFSDHWRRVNIYWKDFMQKVFYYPAVFRFRKWGPNTAIVLATMWVFLATWFLHAYQWFWIRGQMLWIAQDVLFWTFMGALVVVNSLYEIKFGRKRSLGKPKFTWRAVFILTLKSMATFWFVCFLWSFWMSDKIADWLSLWSALGGAYDLKVLTWPLITFVVFFLGNIPRTKAETEPDPQAAQRAWLVDRGVTFAMIAVLVGVTLEPVVQKLGPQASTLVHSVREGTLSRIDAARLEKGYYEGLTDVNRFNSQLWETYSKRPRNWLENQGGGLKRFVGGFAQTEMLPSFVYSTDYGRISTNRWGLRDQNYADTPPLGTLRMAVLGSSLVMGWGVGDGQTFEALVEARMNKEITGGAYQHYELLNYGVQGYQPPQQLVNYERALRQQPHVMVYVASGRELSRAANYMAEVAQKGIAIPYPELQAIATRAGVTNGMTEVEAQRRLMPFKSDILAFTYSHIAGDAARRGIKLIWVFLPNPTPGDWQTETDPAASLAQRAGFAILRLDNLYAGIAPKDIKLAEWDEHPNVRGHKLIADAMFEWLRANPAAYASAPAQTVTK